MALVHFAIYPARQHRGYRMAASEQLSLCLFLGVGWAFVASAIRPKTCSAIAGLLLGSAVLVRPSLLPAMPAMMLAFLVAPRSVQRRLAMMLIFCSAFLVVLIPWVVRNYAVFGELLLVSSNGGDVFFRANNSLATGGYTVSGDRPLNDILPDELRWNRTGYEWGIEWIRNNPLPFLKLGVIKLGMLLANGAVPIEWTLKGTHGEIGGMFQLIYGLGHAWWILLWGLVGVAFYRHRKRLGVELCPGLLFTLLLVIPLVHSVFESQPRYHTCRWSAFW